MDLITTQTSEVLNKALDGLLARHNAITSNLANVDTPGYKALKVEFEDKLKQAISKQGKNPGKSKQMAANGTRFSGGMLNLNITHEKHFDSKPVTLGNLQFASEEGSVIRTRNDNNTIDIDNEMVSLAKTDMKYQAIAHLQGKHYNGLRDFIKAIQ